MASNNPDRCAIVYNDEKLSFKELNEMSNSLAYFLRQQNIQRNDIIPIICDRSPSYYISIISISKAGGAFLPIDKKLPIDRIKFIIDEVKPKIILYNNTQDIIDKLDNENYNIYNLRNHNYSLNTDNINSINEPNDTCYVLFTSGTTGKPKGALISHFNIYNNLREFTKE
ncbi:acetyl-CoA synthetase-like protein, partial [Anaeromyces robustus]